MTSDRDSALRAFDSISNSLHENYVVERSKKPLLNKGTSPSMKAALMYLCVRARINIAVGRFEVAEPKAEQNVNVNLFVYSLYFRFLPP